MLQELENCFYRVSIKALILDETRTKFLIVQEDNGKWELPGGGLDWGEDPIGALPREISEEMGLKVTYVNPDPAYFVTSQKKPGGIWVANVFYQVKVADLNFTPSEECQAIKFISPEEVQDIDAFPNLQKLAEFFDPKKH